MAGTTPEVTTDGEGHGPPRRMVWASLMGGHTHRTQPGVSVSISIRSGRYLARGRYQGHQFGVTLGADVETAGRALRRLLTDIDDGRFVPPSQQDRKPLGNGAAPRWTLRDLVNDFLAEKRSTRGKQTAETYRSRLMPVLDFAETTAAPARWPLARSIDRDFAIELKAHLQTIRVTRNGSGSGEQKVISSRQVFNILECLRGVLNWACRADRRKLPPEWVNPLTTELVGKPAEKDPLREDPVPIHQRIALVRSLDLWQLCHLGISLVLPCRPEEVAGLLISEVDFAGGNLIFGSRLGGSDFTKGHTSFRLPFPRELAPILRACVGGRSEGPVLRSRTAFERGEGGIGSEGHLNALYDARLASAGKKEIRTPQDRKRLFRKLLAGLGGVTADHLNREFKSVCDKAGLREGVTLYTMRSAVTRSMHDAGVDLLELRYLTGHSTKDILHNYTGLNPKKEMGKYFSSIPSLLEAISERSGDLGIASARTDVTRSVRKPEST